MFNEHKRVLAIGEICNEKSNLIGRIELSELYSSSFNYSSYRIVESLISFINAYNETLFYVSAKYNCLKAPATYICGYKKDIEFLMKRISNKMIFDNSYIDWNKNICELIPYDLEFESDDIEYGIILPKHHLAIVSHLDEIQFIKDNTTYFKDKKLQNNEIIKEMTKEDIEKILGYKINIIG